MDWRFLILFSDQVSQYLVIYDFCGFWKPSIIFFRRKVVIKRADKRLGQDENIQIIYFRI